MMQRFRNCRGPVISVHTLGGLDALSRSHGSPGGGQRAEQRVSGAKVRRWRPTHACHCSRDPWRPGSGSWTDVLGDAYLATPPPCTPPVPMQVGAQPGQLRHPGPHRRWKLLDSHPSPAQGHAAAICYQAGQQAPGEACRMATGCLTTASDAPA